MDIGRLWFTQKSLWRAEQIPALIQDIRSFEYTPREFIWLRECADGEVEILNGHHRVAAFWLAGMKDLSIMYYRVIHAEQPLVRRWRVSEISRWHHLVEHLKVVA